MVPPPGRFSTTTGWPRSAASGSLSVRAALSKPPPGGCGTMMRTGRTG
jgi:hypothetical protein